MLTMKSMFAIAFFIFIIALFIFWQTQAYKTPEPSFEVINQEGSIETRIYPPIIIAEVSVNGERYAAINAGFKKLANYIFGNNTSQKKIAMTAPVIQKNEKIAMTAPVMMQAENNHWVVQFVMPADASLSNLPTPNNTDVHLKEIPQKKYIVIQFSGRNSEENIDEHLKMLHAYVKKNNIMTQGEPLMAFYNPPWILPFLRRNEIMLEVK
jgi:effector-binding domain-containing protein